MSPNDSCIHIIIVFIQSDDIDPYLFDVPQFGTML